MASVNHIAPLPIAFVMTSFSPGGTERQMIELVRRLDRSRWTVYVACFHTRGAWFDRVAEAARAVVEFPVTSFRQPGFLRQLGAFAVWCRRMRLAVLHPVDMPANMFGPPGAALGGVPVRVENRRDVNPGRKAVELVWQRAAYACAHVIVANCGAAAARLRKERVPARRIQVIPNGLEIDAYPPRIYGSRPRRVITVGDLRPEKGHTTLIAAAADVLREFPDAQFEIVGAGPELGRLRSLARSHGVSHAVVFAGHREDVAARLAAADAFALPSRSEAMPNALLEAMGSGLSIVASHVGGVPELIE